PAASTEPAVNTVDLGTDGTLSYTAGAALANTLSVSLAAGTYTLSDASGPITLSAAAQAAGWTGNGTTAVTGPAASFTRLSVATGTGADTVTISGADRGLVVDAGSQTGDAVNVTGTITTGGADFAVLRADTVTAAAGSLINTGNGTVHLSANAVGTAAAPIFTQAGKLQLNAGDGGAFATESAVAAVA